MGRRNDDLINLQAQQLALQAAQAAAQQEFLRMRFMQLELPQFQHMSTMDKERLAFEKSTETFNQTMKMIQLTGKLPDGTLTVEAALQRAQVTGLLDGEETLAAKQLRAQMSGFYDGEMTTEEQQRQFTNQISQAGLTGLFNGQLTTQEQQRQFQNLITQAQQTGMFNGQETIDWAAKKAGITGYFDGNATLARQAQEEQTALGLLNTGAQLSGPADIFKFLRTFAGTPNGMMDLLNATAGRYQLPGFTGGNMQGNPDYAPATVSSLTQNMLGAAQAGGAMGNPTGNANIWQTSSSVAAPPAGGLTVNPNAGIPPYTPNANIWSTPTPAPIAAQDELQSTTANVANIVNGVSAMNDAMPTASNITPYPETQPAPVNQYNYQPMGDGRYYVYPPGQEAPADAYQYSSQVPLQYSELNSFAEGGGRFGGGPKEPPEPGYVPMEVPIEREPGYVPMELPWSTATSGNVWSQNNSMPHRESDYETYLNNLVAPTKINAENYGNMSTFQKQALQSAYGEKGYTPQNFEELFKKSLPRYAGPAQGSFA